MRRTLHELYMGHVNLIETCSGGGGHRTRDQCVVRVSTKEVVHRTKAECEPTCWVLFFSCFLMAFPSILALGAAHVSILGSGGFFGTTASRAAVELGSWKAELAFVHMRVPTVNSLPRNLGR